MEGAPGVGKSTFAWKLCSKWSKGKILSQYKLVVLLRLRDKRVREAKTLYDLIYYHDPEEQKLIVREIIKSNGKETLLLFEGYDKLPAQLQKDKDSILMQIISGTFLPKTTVLVTSRHSASGFIINNRRKRISQHIEILGFTKENIQTYINENIEDSEERQGLERYLSCYPHIRTMMYIPLNSVIVVEVYHQCHDKDKPAPKTMTELYTSLVRTLLVHYLRDNPSYKHCTKILEFTDLPDKVYKHLQQISKTAYGGVANGQELIFYDLPVGFETLGLMQEVHELYVDEGDCVSYNFLHHTIQEYLAALHLSMQPMDVQIQHFKEKEAESTFEMVLRFLSGLTKFHNYPQQDLTLILEPRYRRSGLIWLFEAQNVEYISRVLKKAVFSVDNLSTPFEAYALGYCVAHSDLKWESHTDLDSAMKEMLIRGLQAEETQCKGTVSFNEFDIETNKLKPATLKFLRGIMCRITSMSFLSCVTTELVKDLTSCFDKLNVTVKENELQKENCETLGELIRSSTSLRHFSMDTLPTDEDQSAEVAFDICLHPIVTTLGKNSSLESVSFTNGIFLLGAVTALMRTGRSELYPRVLQLLDVSFDDKDGTLFLGKCYTHHPNTTAKYLSPEKICSLFIDSIPCRYVEFISFLSDLCTLSNLVMKDGNLSGNNIKCITEGFLVHCKGIDSKASDEEARSLVDVEGGSGTEQSNKTCTLEHIELTLCDIGPEGAKLLAQALCVNTSVKTLTLSDNPIGDEGAKALAEMLGAESSTAVNTTLEHIDLRKCNMGPVGAQHFAQALRVNTSVKKLVMQQNVFDLQTSEALSDMLTSNNSLTDLNITACNYQPRVLARGLLHNKALRRVTASSVADIMAAVIDLRREEGHTEQPDPEVARCEQLLINRKCYYQRL